VKLRHRLDGDFDRLQRLIDDAIRDHRQAMRTHEQAIDRVREAVDVLDDSGRVDEQRRPDR
jgi:hypothetical protein